MSQIPNIAASLAQSSVQQAQAARASDAERQKAARFSQHMRRVQEDEFEKVETPYEASDEALRVDEEQREAGRDSRQQQRQQEPPPREDAAGGSHLDVTV